MENAILLDEERTQGYGGVIRRDLARWIVAFFIGVLTALVACAIDITIETLSSVKYGVLKRCTYISRFSIDSVFIASDY